MHPVIEHDRKAWRKQKRAELLSLRTALPQEVRRQSSARIIARLGQVLRTHSPACLAAYWAFRGEVDLLQLIEELLAEGWRSALPAIVAKAQPLQFHQWKPGDPMTLGAFGIPSPAAAMMVQPDILLVPLVGFDDKRHRLGNGGGYYDRTLAAAAPKPLTIGVGFEATHLETIYPTAFDIPLDLIVTEDKLR